MLLIPPLSQFFENPKLSEDPDWVTGAMSTARHLMVTSLFDLLITAMPFYFTHLMLNTVHYNWIDGNDLLVSPLEMKPVVVKVKVGRSGSVISVLWGLLLLIESIRAPNMTSCDSSKYNGTCTLEVHPWFIFKKGTCHCLVIQMACHENPELENLQDQESFVELLSTSDIGEKTLYFFAQYCPIETIPPAMSKMRNIVFLEFKSCDLKTLDVSFESWDSILHIFLTENKMEVVPETLKFPPKHLASLVLTGKYIESTPEWITTSWQTLTYLEIGMALKEFPVEILQLQRLTGLNFVLNSNGTIASVPSEIESLNQLRILKLSDCRLKSLPQEITNLASLYQVRLAHNQLETIPWSLDQINTRFITLLGNPICQQPEYATLKACKAD